MVEHRVPKFGYVLDESNPDVAILRHQNGSFVAPFSARGATKEGIVAAAKEDMVGSWRPIQSTNRAKAPGDSGAPTRARNPETFPNYRSA